MNDSTHTDRRTVLKTLGASVVGGTVMVGTAAGQGPDLSIALTQTEEFDPSNPSVSLGQSGSATIDFVNQADHDHNVTVHEDGQTGNRVKSQLIGPGERYQIELEEQSGELAVKETDAYGNAGGTTHSATVDFSGGSTTLEMHCDLHDVPGLPNFSMHGTISVSG